MTPQRRGDLPFYVVGHHTSGVGWVAVLRLILDTHSHVRKQFSTWKVAHLDRYRIDQKSFRFEALDCLQEIGGVYGDKVRFTPHPTSRE